MFKHTPWNLDAYRFFFGPETEDYLLLNKPIKEFLQRDDKFFLVGAKGLGKTLFLRYKSLQFHEKYRDSMRFNVNQTELTENLNLHPDTLTKEELLRFEAPNLWRLIWELGLWVMIFRIFELPISPKLEKIVGDGRQISSIFTRLLNNRGLIEEYRTFLNEFLNQKSKITDGVAIFIDDVDQALHTALKEPHLTDEYFEGKVNPSVAVWVNAQMGLVDAIYNINRQSGHIKIYATIRREAFEAYTGEMRLNYLQHASFLHYEKDDLKIIFEKNIDLLDESQLFRKESRTLIGQFLGFDRLQHRFAIDLSGNPRQENSFDFIYRHTFGRPREMMLMGAEIDTLVTKQAYLNDSNEARIEKLRVKVNEVASFLMNQYAEETIPYLSDSKLLEFVKKVRSNVITKEDTQKLDEDFFKQLFNFGLVGYVRAVNMQGQLKQAFNPPATYNYRKPEPLPDTDYFLIHSAMNGRLMERHTYGNFYNKYNIIGHGYDFFPNTDHHIHDMAYYLPIDVSGNRMNASNEAAGHEFPLIEIYNKYFDFQNNPHRYELFDQNWGTASKVLGLLARICYCNRLNKQFLTTDYSPIMKELSSELEHFYFKRQYNARLRDSSSVQAFSIFSDKLIGRFITLGCYLVLDMRINWIYQLLRNGLIEFNDETNDAAFPYLSRSFFIRDLQRTEPREPDNPEHRQIKQRIFNYLSDCEKESLKTFIRDASDEVQFLNLIKTEEHRKWVEESILRKLWRPD